jgi:hypothetical protein
MAGRHMPRMAATELVAKPRATLRERIARTLSHTRLTIAIAQKAAAWQTVPKAQELGYAR